MTLRQEALIVGLLFLLAANTSEGFTSGLFRTLSAIIITMMLWLTWEENRE